MYIILLIILDCLPKLKINIPKERDPLLFGEILGQSCGFNANFTLIDVNHYTEQETIFPYCAMVFIMGLLQSFNAIWLTHKIFDDSNCANMVSIFTIGLNIVWNGYICINNFYISMFLVNFILIL
jgi:hypothetical protein